MRCYDAGRRVGKLMKTPIFDFVKDYAESDRSRFHMPGHKGRPFVGCEELDITEVEGADVLSQARGIIAQSEGYAAELFGTAHSFYSTEGSTLCIKAMLSLAAKNAPRGQRRRILAARNVHKAFVYGCGLLDLDVSWIYPERAGHLCSCQVTAEQIERRLQNEEDLPIAVYITSPDYLGNVADIEGIAKVCHDYRLPLLVDNAHGAYLKFFSPTKHPIALGADICCDSAHKTFPVLTGGAYLHISKGADPRYGETARDMMAVFATTSPSYLILQSLDLCNRYLSEGYSERLRECAEKIDRVKAQIRGRGFVVEDTEPLKITVNAAASGFVGEELAEHLRRYRIEPEFADREYLVLMASPETRDIDFERLLSAFETISPKKAHAAEEQLTVCPLEAVMSIRDAIFAPCEPIPTALAEGRICGAPTVSCPPAIPIVISGERITREAVELFNSYGIDTVKVVI